MLAQSGEYDTDTLPDGWDQEFKTLTKDDETIDSVIIANCTCASCPRDEETGKPTCTRECECSESSELHYYVTIYVR